MTLTIDLPHYRLVNRLILFSDLLFNVKKLSEKRLKIVNSFKFYFIEDILILTFQKDVEKKKHFF